MAEKRETAADPLTCVVESADSPQKATALDVTLRVAFALLTIIMAIVAWQGRVVIHKVDENESRITRIEANRYTAADALSDRRAIGQDLRELRMWIEMNYPPAWLQEDIRELKAEMQQLRREVRVQHPGNKGQ